MSGDTTFYLNSCFQKQKNYKWYQESVKYGLFTKTKQIIDLHEEIKISDLWKQNNTHWNNCLMSNGLKENQDKKLKKSEMMSEQNETSRKE